MKKTLLLAGIASFLLIVGVNAQDTTTTKPVMQDTSAAMPKMQDTTAAMPKMQDTTAANANMNQQPNLTQSQPTTQEQKKYGNPTVDSILSKYTLIPMPNPITTEQIFPVIGQFQSNANADQKLTITLDDQNKGIVWIDGMPQGRVKAVEKKSPATYKIPAQKTAEGNDVPEGTLIYDKDANVINVMLGRSFNDADPASVFATANTADQTMAPNAQANEQMNVAKTKGKKAKVKVKKEEPAPWVFTGTKILQGTALNQ